MAAWICRSANSQEASRRTCARGLPRAVTCGTQYTSQAMHMICLENTVTLFTNTQMGSLHLSPGPTLRLPRHSPAFLRTHSSPESWAIWLCLKLRRPHLPHSRKMTIAWPPRCQLEPGLHGGSHFVFHLQEEVPSPHHFQSRDYEQGTGKRKNTKRQ